MHFFSNLDGSEYNLGANVYNIILNSPVNIKKIPRVSKRINKNNGKSRKQQKQKWDDVT